MDLKLYTGKLYERYGKYYNISKNVVVLDEPIDIMAEFKDVQGRTFLNPKDIIDSYEINEICYVKQIDKIDISSISNFIDFLKRTAEHFVQPKIGHMCTYITGVLITQDHLENELIDAVKKFKYSKSYFFTLHGWCEIRLLIINPDKEKIITNKPGNKAIQFYKFK